MRALAADGSESDFKRRQYTMEWLLITRHQALYSFGRSSGRRVVNVFRGGKFLADQFETTFQILATDALAQATAMTEEQPFELVHHNERNESTCIEMASHGC